VVLPNPWSIVTGKPASAGAAGRPADSAVDPEEHPARTATTDTTTVASTACSARRRRSKNIVMAGKANLNRRSLAMRAYLM
jgi:hypothetical protein